MSGNRSSLRQDEGALRILEALSAVDEELLERSGMPVAEDGTKPYDEEKVTDLSLYKRITGMLWRYRRICAACLALMAVGAVSWNGLHLARMIWGGAGAEYSGGSEGSNQTTAGNAAMWEQDASDGGIAENFIEETEIKVEEEASLEAGREEGARGSGGEEIPAGGTQRDESSFTLEESLVDETGRPSSFREATEEEVRADETLGSYLPAQLPAGYSFESARIDDRRQLYICWTRGMDSIMISVAIAAVEDFETVDVGQPETYDERLYEIPYGETVPEKYQKSFYNPVFAAEDLSLEVVSSRMKSYEDAGDTNTPRGSFSVLYPEGVLVRFNGRGTAEEIWNMFSSLER